MIDSTFTYVNIAKIGREIKGWQDHSHTKALQQKDFSPRPLKGFKGEDRVFSVIYRKAKRCCGPVTANCRKGLVVHASEEGDGAGCSPAVRLWGSC